MNYFTSLDIENGGTRRIWITLYTGEVSQGYLTKFMLESGPENGMKNIEKIFGNIIISIKYIKYESYSGENLSGFIEFTEEGCNIQDEFIPYTKKLKLIFILDPSGLPKDLATPELTRPSI